MSQKISSHGMYLEVILFFLLFTDISVMIFIQHFTAASTLSSVLAFQMFLHLSLVLKQQGQSYFVA